ncbi:MAG TPA: hypothetical protein VFG00_13505 [Acidothermaceae bacterium]|nr:hypothetical protein [Acidothermaceae bacterium]
MSDNGRGALVTVAAAVSLVVVGIVTGFIGVMQATTLVKLGAVHLCVGAVIAGVANCLFGLLAVWGLGSRDASALPALGWFVAVAVALFGPRPGGDILLPGSGWDVISFAVAGPVGAVLAGVFGGRVISTKTSPDIPPAASPETPPDR